MALLPSQADQKLRATLAVGVSGVLLAVVAGAFALDYQGIFMNGALSANHASPGFAREAALLGVRSTCQACHTAGHRLSDTSCRNCHPAQLALTKHINVARLRCADCHREHKGADQALALAPRAQCIHCHARVHQPKDVQPLDIPNWEQSCHVCHLEHGKTAQPRVRSLRPAQKPVGEATP